MKKEQMWSVGVQYIR